MSNSSPKNIQIADYNYTLPEEKIAKYPLSRRDFSKLLVYNSCEINEILYKDLTDVLPSDTLLIFNNTRVVEARMFFQTFTGAVVELFFLEAVSDVIDASKAMACKGKIEVKCYVGNAKRWKHGSLKRVVESNGKLLEVTVSNKERISDYYHVTISWTPTEVVFAEVLHAFGSLPLPPYLKRETEETDLERYQTVFAKELGSVAAPTAGLHFTDTIFKNILKKGIETTEVTLHVGAGTFKPVKSEEIGGHEMHGEYLQVSVDSIKLILDSCERKKIVTVGTTSTRTIESLYWLGRKVFFNPSILHSDLVVSQWEPYEMTELCGVKEAMQALINWLEKNSLNSILSKTQIIIAPGYKFQIIDGLITNFHQPESTLLLLISALIGEEWKRVYDYALENDFRFLSYGDGSLLWKQ